MLKFIKPYDIIKIEGIDSYGKQQKNYVNGLKNLACLMVMLGHFIGIYKYAEFFPFTSTLTSYADIFLNSKLSFLIDETFWVILFFFVSGYLVSMSKIPDFKSFLFKSFTRFLRLELPVLSACLIILILQKIFGFYTNETMSIFKNSFIQTAYRNDISVWQVLLSPFDVLILGKAGLCGPFWILGGMFVFTKTATELNLLLSALISISVSTIFTFLISVLYHFTFEIYIFKLINLLSDWWRKICII